MPTLMPKSKWCERCNRGESDSSTPFEVLNDSEERYLPNHEMLRARASPSGGSLSGRGGGGVMGLGCSLTLSVAIGVRTTQRTEGNDNAEQELA